MLKCFDSAKSFATYILISLLFPNSEQTRDSHRHKIISSTLQSPDKNPSAASIFQSFSFSFKGHAILEFILTKQANKKTQPFRYPNSFTDDAQDTI